MKNFNSFFKKNSFSHLTTPRKTLVSFPRMTSNPFTGQKSAFNQTNNILGNFDIKSFGVSNIKTDNTSKNGGQLFWKELEKKNINFVTTPKKRKWLRKRFEQNPELLKLGENSRIYGDTYKVNNEQHKPVARFVERDNEVFLNKDLFNREWLDKDGDNLNRKALAHELQHHWDWNNLPKTELEQFENERTQLQKKYLRYEDRQGEDFRTDYHNLTGEQRARHREKTAFKSYYQVPQQEIDNNYNAMFGDKIEDDSNSKNYFKQRKIGSKDDDAYIMSKIERELGLKQKGRIRVVQGDNDDLPRILAIKKRMREKEEREIFEQEQVNKLNKMFPVDDDDSKNKFGTKAGVPIVDYPESYGYKRTKVLMTPDEFMRKAQQGYRDEESRQMSKEKHEETVIFKPKIPELKNIISHPTKEMDVPWLETKQGKIYDHEGRHRAIAAREAGYEEIPVFMLETDKEYIRENIEDDDDSKNNMIARDGLSNMQNNIRNRSSFGRREYDKI